MLYLRSVFQAKGEGSLIFENGNMIGVEGKTLQFYVDGSYLRIEVNWAEGNSGSAAL